MNYESARDDGLLLVWPDPQGITFVASKFAVLNFLRRSLKEIIPSLEAKISNNLVHS